MRMIYKRLLSVLGSLTTVVLAGIAGYMLIERWGFFDALYMTVITIASVGFMEVHTLSPQGRAFTIVLILCGSATLIYGLSVLTTFFVEGELTDYFRRRRMNNAIARLRGHYIVCGVSATGRYVIDELTKTGRSFVVIDHDPEKLRPLAEAGILHLNGDATQDAVLVAANIAAAAGLFSALHSDADNLLTVVTARGLHPQLKVIVKAFDEESERKLRQVGASGVVMPNFIGGMRMVSEMIRPSVVTFLDTMLRVRESVVRVEEIHCPAGSSLIGQTLAEAGLLDVAEVTVVAVCDRAGNYHFNPPRELVLQADDVLIVMGNVACIQALVAGLAPAAAREK
jgi:voltage-gated potassium channel